MTVREAAGGADARDGRITRVHARHGRGCVECIVILLRRVGLADSIVHHVGVDAARGELFVRLWRWRGAT